MIIYGYSIDNRKIKRLFRKHFNKYLFAISIMIIFIILWNS
jgi:hypothetical protein